MIENKFLHYETQAGFEADRQNIADSSIVFVKDTRKIYTHGGEYSANIDTIDIEQDEDKIMKIVDKDDQVLFTISKDGSINWAVGIPTPIKDYIKSLNLDKVDWEACSQASIEKSKDKIMMLLDAENRIISYRDTSGTLHEDGIETNHLTLSDTGMTEFQQALKDAGFNPGGAGDWSDTITNKGKNPVYIPTPRCAMVNILSDINLSQLSKADAGGTQKVNYDVKVQVEFFDGQGNYFKKWALLSAQGSSSMAFIKKNLSLKFFDTEDVEGSKKKWGKGDTFGTVFGDWVMQKTYHLKAYYTNYLRGSAVVAYQIADQVDKTLPAYANRTWKKASLNYDDITSNTPIGMNHDNTDDLLLQIDNGARCMPDGFPCIVYQQGEFYGIYCWQLKKDAANFNMDEENPNHIHLDGILGTDFFSGNIHWNEFEIRNPGGLITATGDDYDGDFPTEIMGNDNAGYDPNDESHVFTNAVKQYIKDLAQTIPLINSTTGIEAKRQLFEATFDVDNLVDYQLVNMAIGDPDGFRKNWQWTTWDGTKWYVNQYDKDMAFGVHFSGTFCFTPFYGWIYNDPSLPIGFAIQNYTQRYKERWQELVDAGIFTVQNFSNKLTEWCLRIGEQNFKREWQKWPNSPCNRDSGINFQYWEFNGRYKDSLDSGDTQWNASTTYQTDDQVYFLASDLRYVGFTAKTTNTNKPPLTITYEDGYPSMMGYRGSLWRYIKYAEEQLDNQNNFFENL